MKDVVKNIRGQSALGKSKVTGGSMAVVKWRFLRKLFLLLLVVSDPTPCAFQHNWNYHSRSQGISLGSSTSNLSGF